MGINGSPIAPDISDVRQRLYAFLARRPVASDSAARIALAKVTLRYAYAVYLDSLREGTAAGAADGAALEVYAWARRDSLVDAMPWPWPVKARRYAATTALRAGDTTKARAWLAEAFAAGWGDSTETARNLACARRVPPGPARIAPTQAGHAGGGVTMPYPVAGALVFACAFFLAVAAYQTRRAATARDPRLDAVAEVYAGIAGPDAPEGVELTPGSIIEAARASTSPKPYFDMAREMRERRRNRGKGDA